jgi:hypothetical protein
MRSCPITDHILQPNPAQVVAIESAAEKCLRKAGPIEVVKAQDLQNPDASPEPALESVGNNQLNNQLVCRTGISE